jgi:hypothetical protein
MIFAFVSPILSVRLICRMPVSTRLSSPARVPDVESMLKLGPDQFGCALLKVINLLPEGMQHRHNHLLMLLSPIEIVIGRQKPTPN